MQPSKSRLKMAAGSWLAAGLMVGCNDGLQIRARRIFANYSKLQRAGRPI